MVIGESNIDQHHSGGLVNSYEIYGEKEHSDDEVEEDESQDGGYEGMQFVNYSYENQEEQKELSQKSGR